MENPNLKVANNYYTLKLDLSKKKIYLFSQLLLKFVQFLQELSQCRPFILVNFELASVGAVTVRWQINFQQVFVQIKQFCFSNIVAWLKNKSNFLIRIS